MPKAFFMAVEMSAPAFAINLDGFAESYLANLFFCAIL